MIKRRQIYSQLQQQLRAFEVAVNAVMSLLCVLSFSNQIALDNHCTCELILGAHLLLV